MKKIKLFVSVMVIATMMLVSFGVQASGGLTVTTDVFTGRCKVIVSFDNCINESVSIEVIPADVESGELSISSDALQTSLSKIVYLNHTSSNSLGNASFEVPIKSSGEYVVRVHSLNNSGDAVKETINFISKSDATDVWENLVLSPSENLPKLFEILNIKDELILSFVSDIDLLSLIEEYGDIGAFTKENADTLISKIKSDCEDITLLKDVLSKIENIQNISQIKSILSVEANAAILGVAEYMERYNALKNTKIVDLAVAGKTFTKSTFQSAFIKGIEDAEKEETEKPTVIPPSKPTTGSVGGSLGGSVSNTAVQPPVLPVSHPFVDISTVSWAAEAITTLYNEGIISGKSANEFAPSDNITREEFVKIAIGVLGVKPVSGASAFADVNSSSWYAPYVNAAVSAYIISGYSDTQFGVGDYITRQDVAVILDRIYKHESTGELVNFTDTDEISDYAKASVERLSGAGVINGSDGKFMPKSNCTRAEVACMVYRMMSLMKEGK